VSAGPDSVTTAMGSCEAWQATGLVRARAMLQLTYREEAERQGQERRGPTPPVAAPAPPAVPAPAGPAPQNVMAMPSRADDEHAPESRAA
jgi:hypothetical protein